jgi:hypothetical protein
MSEKLKSQILSELKYHQQEVTRLQQMLKLCDGQGVRTPVSSTESSGTARGTTQEVPLKLYKKRVQTPEVRKRIGDFQRKRHAAIRAAKEAAAKDSQASSTPSSNPSGNPSAQAQ